MSSTATTKTDADTATTVMSSLLSVEISVVTQIDAPPQAVWRVLKAANRFAEWNPFIISFEGMLEIGAGITVMLALPNRKPQTLRPKIIQLDEGRSLTGADACGRAAGATAANVTSNAFAVAPVGHTDAADLQIRYVPSSWRFNASASTTKERPSSRMINTRSSGMGWVDPASPSAVLIRDGRMSAAFLA